MSEHQQASRASSRSRRELKLQNRGAPKIRRYRHSRHSSSTDEYLISTVPFYEDLQVNVYSLSQHPTYTKYSSMLGGSYQDKILMLVVEISNTWLQKDRDLLFSIIKSRRKAGGRQTNGSFLIIILLHQSSVASSLKLLFVLE